MATIDTNYIAPGGTAADDKAERSGSKTPDFYKKFNEPQAYGPNRYEELAEDSITSEAGLQQSSELQEYEKQIGGLVGEIRESQQRLDQIAQNPQLLQVPMDQPISFMAKLGAALSNVGGDSSPFMALLKQKQALADQQRQVAFQNVAIQNAFDNQLRSEMIDRLSQDRARLGQLTLIKSKVLDDLALEGRNREDAALKLDIEIVRNTHDYTAADVFADPKNVAAAERMGLSQSELEYQQGWSIARDPAAKQDPLTAGQYIKDWEEAYLPGFNSALVELSSGGHSQDEIDSIARDWVVKIASIESRSEGGILGRENLKAKLAQAIAEGHGIDEATALAKLTEMEAEADSGGSIGGFFSSIGGGIKSGFDWAFGNVIENERAQSLKGKRLRGQSVSDEPLSETALESATQELDTFFTNRGGQ